MVSSLERSMCLVAVCGLGKLKGGWTVERV